MKRVTVGVLVLLVLAGCAQSPKPDPTPTRPLPTRVSSTATALCGVDPQSLELATGHEVSAPSGELTPGSGYCSVVGAEGSPSDKQLIVRIDPVDSDEARQELAAIRGVGAREPDVRYGDVDGAAWAFPTPNSDTRWSLGGQTIVAWGDYVVLVITGATGSGRDTAADLLALVQQVASSAGLGPYPTPTSPAVTPSS